MAGNEVTDGDYEITGDHTVNLRAQRSGKEAGRTYTITVECSDGVNTLTDTTIVTVPHDQKRRVGRR